MSCVLRAYGGDFDVDQYLSQVEDLQDVLILVRRKGQKLWEGQKRPKFQSGFNLRVSDAEFSEVEQQLQDADTFLHRYGRALAHLKTFPGVEDIDLDFGIEDRDVATQADYFPTLLGQMAELGIGLVVSRYPRSDPEGESDDLVTTD